MVSEMLLLIDYPFHSFISEKFHQLIIECFDF